MEDQFKVGDKVPLRFVDINDKEEYVYWGEITRVYDGGGYIWQSKGD